MSTFKEELTAVTIICGALFLMWAFMMRPYTFEWTPAGETTGTIKTLMSNSNVIGVAYIQAVVTLDNGRQTIIRVPLDEDIRAGSSIVLSVDTDANNEQRKRYSYKKRDNR